MASPVAPSPTPSTARSSAGAGARLEVAARRLEQAVARLRQRLAARLAEANADVGGLFDHDRSLLAAELDAAKARNRELEAAAADARAAVEQAMVQMRQVPPSQSGGGRPQGDGGGSRGATSQPEAEA